MKLTHAEVRGLTVLTIILAIILFAVWWSTPPAPRSQEVEAASHIVDHPSPTSKKPRKPRKGKPKKRPTPPAPDRLSPHDEPVAENSPH